MTAYKAVLAADMDFTLLLPGEDIPPENAAAVKRLQENGIAFTIATGRSSFLVGKFAERLGIEIPIITGNGGALFDPVSRKDIMSMDFTDQKVRKLLRLMIENEVNATLYSPIFQFTAQFSDARIMLRMKYRSFLIIRPECADCLICRLFRTAAGVHK